MGLSLTHSLTRPKPSYFTVLWALLGGSAVGVGIFWWRAGTAQTLVFYGTLGSPRGQQLAPGGSYRRGVVAKPFCCNKNAKPFFLCKTGLQHFLLALQFLGRTPGLVVQNVAAPGFGLQLFGVDLQQNAMHFFAVALHFCLPFFECCFVNFANPGLAKPGFAWC